MRRFFWPMMTLLSAASMAAFARTTSAAAPAASAIDHRERHVSMTLRRAAQYVDVPHISSRPACADVQPPQALTTPDPLLTSSSASSGKIKVSFIIGTDGRVHSPLILESAGVAGDRRVLQTVRAWRYRPATCNGVPTETEGKIEFSNR
jgi:TonB family protein